jgi:hypothetical protein
MSRKTKKQSRRPPVVSRIRSWQRLSGLQPATAYDRTRDLPALLPVALQLLGASEQTACTELIGFLRRALRCERTRGIAGHWAYDLGRHAALLRAYHAEVDAIAIARDGASPPKTQLR